VGWLAVPDDTWDVTAANSQDPAAGLMLVGVV
jgi:hypothetical protein